MMTNDEMIKVVRALKLAQTVIEDMPIWLCSRESWEAADACDDALRILWHSYEEALNKLQSIVRIDALAEGLREKGHDVETGSLGSVVNKAVKAVKGRQDAVSRGEAYLDALNKDAVTLDAVERNFATLFRKQP